MPVENIYPVNDGVASQLGIRKKESIQIHNVSTPHSRTTLVADPEHIRDAVVVHVMPV